MNIKKLMALGLAAGLSASVLAGCGGSSNSSQSSSQSSSSSASSSSSESSSEAKKGPANISVMLIDYNGNALGVEKSKEVIQKVEEYTNTKINFTWVASDSYEDKLGITLMSDDMPQIIAVSGTNATIVSAAKAGAFWDLAPFIKDSASFPNLSQANANVNKQITLNGQLIGIYRARPIGRNGVGYRKDWAEKLGLGEPKTIEDIYNMAKAFTEKDPDGNGKKDTYGIALCKYSGPFDIMQTWFGAGNGWVEKDGKLVPNFQTEEYMEALKFFKKMYDEGLVYKDFAVRDTATWLDSIKNGECGIYIDVLDGSRRAWDYFVTNNIPAVTGNGTASMNLVGAIAKDASSQPKTLATSGFGGYFVVTKSAKTEDDVKNCLHLLDKMCDDEMRLLADYGLEGYDWQVNDKGNLEVLTKDQQLNQKSMNGLNQLIAYIPYRTGGYQVGGRTIKVESTERTDLQAKVISENEKYAVFNPAAGYLINSETYSLNGANLDQIISDARTQYICGQIDEAGLKAAWDNWAAQGGTTLIEEINNLYKQDKK